MRKTPESGSRVHGQVLVVSGLVEKDQPRGGRGLPSHRGDQSEMLSIVSSVNASFGGKRCARFLLAFLLRGAVGLEAARRRAKSSIRWGLPLTLVLRKLFEGV